MRASRWFAVLAWLVLCIPARAEVYRFVDGEGRVHFTSDLHAVPAEQRAAASASAERERPAGGTLDSLGAASQAPVSRATSRRRSAAAPPRVYTVQVERAGTGMLVMVRLNDRVDAPFLIDTGARDVLVPQAVADALGIETGPDTRKARYHTANGVVEHPVVQLDAVELGGARVEGVPASVSPNMRIGLLGLSFFNHFRYEIDAAEGVVRLRENDLAETGLIRGGRSEAQWRAEFASLEARREQVAAELGSQGASHGRERARLNSLLADLERDGALLESEADEARVPTTWRE
ncbi:hypothetical protein MYXO_01997 [Myxococcaceae bacterium]|nr:hypothetical protein MYXO_01997 [Myxococcaceae bacterium]